MQPCQSEYSPLWKDKLQKSTSIPLAKEPSHCSITIHCPSFLSEFVKDLPLLNTLCTFSKSSCKEICVTKPQLCCASPSIYTQRKRQTAHVKEEFVITVIWSEMATITSRHLGKGLGFAGLLKTSKRAV